MLDYFQPVLAAARGLAQRLLILIAILGGVTSAFMNNTPSSAPDSDRSQPLRRSSVSPAVCSCASYFAILGGLHADRHQHHILIDGLYARPAARGSSCSLHPLGLIYFPWPRDVVILAPLVLLERISLSTCCVHVPRTSSPKSSYSGSP